MARATALLWGIGVAGVTPQPARAQGAPAAVAAAAPDRSPAPAAVAGRGVSPASLVARADAAPGPALRLDEVYAELAARNPRIRAARQLARAAEARVPGTRRPPDPQLQFGFMNYGVPSLRPMETLGMNQLQVVQMLPVAGKLGLAGASAEARAAAEQARATDVQWELRARVAAAFYDVYQYDRSIAVAVETRRLMQDLARIAETMYRVGEGRQADVLRAQVEVARMTEEIVRMQAMRTGAAARLNALLDRPAETPVAEPALPGFPSAVPTLDSLQEAAQLGRPMIRGGERDLQAARSTERLARREIWPDLEVGFQYGQRGAVAGTGPNAMPAGTDRMGSLMFGATLPIFARSRQLRMREEAAAMREMATADLNYMRADTRGRVAEMYADLTRARSLQSLYRTTILPQAEANVTSSLAAYRVGSIPFMTLLDSRTTVNRFRQELAALEADEGRTWAELEMLLGGPLFDATRPGRRDISAAPAPVAAPAVPAVPAPTSAVPSAVPSSPAAPRGGSR